jgi:hypothetical protein
MPTGDIPRKRADAWLADTFEHADPIVANFMARHNALLERVTVLETAMEKALDQIAWQIEADGWRGGGIDNAIDTLRAALDA